MGRERFMTRLFSEKKEPMHTSIVSISLSTIKITRLSVRHQDELSVRPHLRLEVTDEIYALEQELLPIIRAIPIHIRFSLRKFQRFHQEDQ